MIEKLSMTSPVGGASLSAPAVNRVSGPAAADSEDFGAMMSEMIASSVGTIRAAEAASIAGIKGEVSVRQVAETVMAAEQTLQTGIAIRDKVVAAYLELSRMAI